MDNFKYFMPFGKVEKTDDGCRIVSGYASTPRLDLDGEIVSTKAIQKALPGYMEWRNIRQMHQPIAVGTAKEAHTDEDGLYLTARIVDPACVKLIDEDVLKGFSIGGKKMAKKGNTITEIELIEISVVDRPANPDCAFSVAKAAKTTELGKSASVTMGYIGDEPSTESADEVGFLRGLVAKMLGGSSPAIFHTGEAVITPAMDRRLRKTTTFLEDLDNDPGEIEFAKLCKREFSDKERETAADNGEAMPGGGYPIKTPQDLKNAVQAFGRAKNKDATKSHIIRRAKALGATEHLPADWEGSTKEKAATPAMKTAIILADDPLFGGEGIGKSVVDLALDPLFGGEGNPLALAEQMPELFGLEVPQALIEFAKAPYSAPLLVADVRSRLAKGIGTVGDLACAFSMIRSAQRSLFAEGFIEKDGDDAAMAKKLGEIASELATVMATKAQHEGSEAQYLTDADDINSWMLSQGVVEMNSQASDLVKRAAAAAGKAMLGKVAHHLMKAGKAHADMQKCMTKLAGMHGAHVRKTAAATALGKEAEGDGFDHGTAMKLISTMHGHAEEAADHMEMAHAALGKAAGGGDSAADTDAAGDANGTVIGSWGGASVTGKTNMEMTEGEVPWYDAVEPYPGKAAKAAVPGAGFVSVREAHLMAENAALKAVATATAKTPGGVFKGRTIIAPAGSDPTGQGDASGGSDLSLLMNGIEHVDQNDPTSVKNAAGKMIGNMLANSGRFGKSVFDPDFRGQAGVKRASN